MGDPVPGQSRQLSPIGAAGCAEDASQLGMVTFFHGLGPHIALTVSKKPACRGERRIVRGVGCVMCVEVSLRSDRPSRENKAICSIQRTPPAGVEAMTQVAPKINDNCVRLCIHFGFIFKIFSHSKF